MIRRFTAMGTTFYLRAEGVAPSVLADAEALVQDREARLSRFRPDSALSILNRAREVRDGVLAAVVRRAIAAREQTSGAFDPTLGEALCAAGYDRSFSELSGVVSGEPRDVRPTLHTSGDVVGLSGAGRLDLGGIAKGWTVDEVGAWLSAAGATRYLVDGGGDIVVSGGHWVGIGDVHALWLEAGAVATSSTLKRRWTTSNGEAHHILDPRTGRSATGPYQSAAVVAADVCTADVLATALIAAPALAWPAVQAQAQGAMVLSEDGWMVTPELEARLQ